MGKSRLLHLLARPPLEDGDGDAQLKCMCLRNAAVGDDFRDVLRSATGVAVTFNGHSHRDLDAAIITSAENALAVRLLWSHFSGVKYSEFVHFVLQHGTACPFVPTALETVRADVQTLTGAVAPNLVLCVDELLLSGNSELVLASLGGPVLDELPWVHVVLSSVSQMALLTKPNASKPFGLEYRTQTDRQVDLLQLPLLSADAVRELAVLHNRDHEEGQRWWPAPANAAPGWQTADEVLASTIGWPRLIGETFLALDTLGLDLPPQWSAVLSHMDHQHTLKFISAGSAQFRDAVKWVFLGDKPDTSNLQQLAEVDTLSAGGFLKRLRDNSLRLPIIVVRAAFVALRRDRPTFEGATAVMAVLGAAHESILLGPPSGIDAKAFEQRVACTLRIRVAASHLAGLWDDTRPTSLFSLLATRQHTPIAVLPHDSQSAVHGAFCPLLKFATVFLSKAELGVLAQRDALAPGTIYIPRDATNEGFDLVMVPPAGPLAVIQVKLSVPGAATTAGNKDVADAIEKTLKYHPWLADRFAGAGACLVFFARRPATNNISIAGIAAACTSKMGVAASQHTIVLAGAHVEALLSADISGRC
jgi:hypothetical protein